jgi:hypothetical protein
MPKRNSLKRLIVINFSEPKYLGQKIAIIGVLIGFFGLILRLINAQSLGTIIFWGGVIVVFVGNLVYLIIQILTR